MASVPGPQFSILNGPSWVAGASIGVQQLASCSVLGRDLSRVTMSALTMVRTDRAR